MDKAAYDSLTVHDHFYLSLGYFTAHWSFAEYALDLCIALVFHSFGGKTIKRKLPKTLDRKIEFCRLCQDGLPILKGHPLADLADRFDAISSKRHTLIHGIAINWGERAIEMVKIRHTPDMHVEERSSTDPKQIMQLSGDALSLCTDTMLYAGRLLRDLEVADKQAQIQPS